MSRVQYPQYDESKYRPLTIEEIKQLRLGDRVQFVSRTHDVRRIKINGAPKTWKTRPHDVKVPVKYGLYEFSYSGFVGGVHFGETLVTEIDS